MVGFLSDKAWAIGLGVDPGEITIVNVPLGKKVAVSVLGGERVKLKIENKGNSAYTYTINILYSSETQTSLRVGYVDIPDTSWIWPEKKEVTISGKSKEVVELYLKIPKKKEYYNKRYQAIVEVTSKKNRPEELFVLACQVQMCFSTFAGKRGKQQEERLQILPPALLKELPGSENAEDKKSCDKCGGKAN
jgi:hypothetical protein